MPRKKTSPNNWRQPLIWDGKAAKAGTRPRVFCMSMGDWADAEAPEEWREQLFNLIALTNHLEWLLLSKRHSQILKHLQHYGVNPNKVRIGVTVEDQHHADMRLPYLAKVKAAGYKTFVSYEPALGPVNWRPWLEDGVVDWLISGGESGAGARHPDLDWFRAPRDDCAAVGVPYHFKQHGAAMPGNVLDGRQHLEFPT